MNVVNVVPMLTPPPSRPRTEPHVPVMAHEVLELLRLHDGDLVVDATLGAGGHTEAILQAVRAHVVAFDRDEHALRLARARLARFEGRVTFVHAPFSELPARLEALGLARRAAGLLADLGVSSMQLDEPARGMSFRAEGPLDMRMDRSSGETALEVIDRLDDEQLADILYRLGEERRSRRVARCIRKARKLGELETTLDLRRAVIRAVGPARIGGVDPSTKTFQALRIAANDELGQLAALLAGAPSVLQQAGRAAIISFHSLEDRMVKQAFADREVWSDTTKKPVLPTEGELADNPRSRSAKLRGATLGLASAEAGLHGGDA